MTRYVTANLAWQLGGDVALVRALARTADVLALVECRDRHNDPVDVAAILGDGWAVVQDTSSGARSGNALAVRRSSGVDIVRHRLRRASTRGRKVQARYLLDVTLDDNGRRTRLAVGHRPLPATGRQDAFDKAVRRFVRACRARRAIQRARGRVPLRWALALDGNDRPSRIAARVDAPHVFGADVMAFVYSAGWGDVHRDAVRMAHTDHHVLTITTDDREAPRT